MNKSGEAFCKSWGEELKPPNYGVWDPRAYFLGPWVLELKCFGLCNPQIFQA